MNSDLVVMGGSAGAIASIMEILKELPEDFPAPICIVIHISPSSASLLPEILNTRCRLQVVPASQGETLQRGTVYVAPPDLHLLIRGNHIELSRGPKENHHRPAIDPLFRSAAVAFASRVTAVLLSGYLDDGSSGVSAIKKAGGTVVVQDPRDTLYPDMPRNAIQNNPVDYVLPLANIVPALLMTNANHVVAAESLEPVVKEVEMTLQGRDQREEDMAVLGTPSRFTCPECKGVLTEIREKKDFRFRCHEGHAYSALTMEKSQDESIEAALWAATRALDDKAELSHKLAERAMTLGHVLVGQRYRSQAKRVKEYAAMLRNLIKDGVSSV